jgi:hypothetical protein
MQYRLRTLLILMAIGPPMLAGAWLYVRPGPWVWLEFATLAVYLVAIALVALLPVLSRQPHLAAQDIVRIPETKMLTAVQ